MASATYSKLLCELVQTGGAQAGYAVAEGYTVVVRDVFCFQAGALNNSAVQVSSQNTGGVIFYQVMASLYTGYQWHGRQVITGGDTLLLDIQGSGPVWARVSGYLLGPN